MHTKLSIASLIALSSVHAATIVNADFEVDNYNPGVTSLVTGTSVYGAMPYPITSTVYGWQYTTISSNPDGFHDIMTPLPSAGFANSGDQYIEFTATSGSLSSFEIYGQIVGLTPGVNYTVSFWHQNNMATAAPLPSAEIWDSTAWIPTTGAFSLVSAAATASTTIPVNASPGTWNQSVLTFTANTPEAVIKIFTNGDHHLYLDDFTITPEPSQTLFSIMGLSLLIRRKRN